MASGYWGKLDKLLCGLGYCRKKLGTFSSGVVRTAQSDCHCAVVLSGLGALKKNLWAGISKVERRRKKAKKAKEHHVQSQGGQEILGHTGNCRKPPKDSVVRSEGKLSEEMGYSEEGPREQTGLREMESRGTILGNWKTVCFERGTLWPGVQFRFYTLVETDKRCRRNVGELRGPCSELARPRAILEAVGRLRIEMKGTDSDWLQ